MTSFMDDAAESRARSYRQVEAFLERIKAERGDDAVLTAAERRQYDDLLESLREADGEVERRRQSDQTIRALTRRIEGNPTPPSTPRKTMHHDDSNLVYRKRDPKTSWVRDFVLHSTGNDPSGECRRRLNRHGEEVMNDVAFAEYRDLSRVDGQGGYA